MNDILALVQELQDGITVLRHRDLAGKLAAALVESADPKLAYKLAIRLAGELIDAKEYFYRAQYFGSNAERFTAIWRAQQANEIVFQLALLTGEGLQEREAPRPGEHQIATRPVAAAVWPLGVLTLALPSGHRARYHEEFQSELYELAASGASRWRQLGYAFRQLTRVFILREQLQRSAMRRLPS